MSKVTVDDRSSRITYSGYWEQTLDRSVTVTSAWDPGSEAIFSFKGIHVAVYGVIPDGDGEVVQVYFSIDNGTAVSQTRQSGSQRVFNELWWESDTLPDGDHTLSMIYQRVNNADMDFRLDFIEYTTPSDATSSTSPTESTSTFSTGTGTQSTQPSTTATSSGSDNGEPLVTSKSQTPIGAIVGGSLGGMLVIVLAALAFLLLKRRRRAAEAKVDPSAPLAPYAVPSQGSPSPPSATKPPMSPSAHGASSVSAPGTTYATSDSGTGLSYQTGPAPDPHPPDLPPPAYDAHPHV